MGGLTTGIVFLLTVVSWDGVNGINGSISRSKVDTADASCAS